MLHHFSIAVDNPLHVAKVIAEVWNGHFFPFPHHQNSYMVGADDEYGTAIEFYPAGTELILGETQVELKQTVTKAHFQAFHVAISVPASIEEIEKIGKREGWVARVCDRGYFKVVEFWIENKLMLEFLPSEFAAQYLNFIQSDALKEFAAQSAS